MARLKSGDGGLNDGSKAGTWRLPSANDFKAFTPSWHAYRALFVNAPAPNSPDERCRYWSSKKPANENGAYHTNVNGAGGDLSFDSRSGFKYAWAVRGGK